MSSMYYTIEVDDWGHRGSSRVNFGLYNPKLGVTVRLFLKPCIPMDKRTWIWFPFEIETKKEENSDNIHPKHPWDIRITVEEDAIIAGRTFPPWWNGPDIFSAHASWSAWIAGCMKCGNSRVVDSNPFIEWWTVRKGDFRWGKNVVRVNLVIKETANKCRKGWLLDFGCKTSNRSSSNWIYWWEEKKHLDTSTYQLFVSGQHMMRQEDHLQLCCPCHHLDPCLQTGRHDFRSTQASHRHPHHGPSCSCHHLHCHLAQHLLGFLYIFWIPAIIVTKMRITHLIQQWHCPNMSLQAFCTVKSQCGVLQAYQSVGS